MHSDEFFMARALQLAKNGLATAKPNPSVGAVIVYNNKVIGEGFTSAYGGAHAEVNAVASVTNKTHLKEATIYVTLEPCSHYGKTPPCADLLVKFQLKRVVVGALDSNSLVSGKGVARLKDAGIKVTVGVLEKECRWMLRRFFVNQEKKRPYILLKWAQTKDGFIAPNAKIKKTPVWISNENSQQLVHKWRAEEHAILVGTNTVVEDNPKLDVRRWRGENPVRIVLDRKMSLSSNFAVKNKTQKTIFITDFQTKIEASNYEDIIKKIDYRKPVASQIANLLYNLNISSVIIEGGLKTLQTFIDENLWDEARVFVGESNFGKGVKAPEINKPILSSVFIKNNILNTYLND